MLHARRILMVLLCAALATHRLYILYERTAFSSPRLTAPRTTKVQKMTEEEVSVDVERRLPSLPFGYWKRNKNKQYKRKCAPLPSVYELEFNNEYWQTLRTSNGTFYLYGAYLDVRPAKHGGPLVRVLGVHDRLKPSHDTHCQLWFEKLHAPVVVRILDYKYIWKSKWGNHRDSILQPYLMGCVLPRSVSNIAPAAVSLVEHPCDRSSNLLRVHYDRPFGVEAKKEFAVCVKSLDFIHEDISMRLVEWIELVTLLGADKVFFYELHVHPNVSRVLDYYVRLGKVDVARITLPGGQPNAPSLQHMYLKKKVTHKRQMEVVPYNDCLYRHLYRYRWLVLLDVDEVIVPTVDADWGALMRRAVPLATHAARNLAPSSYHAAHDYYVECDGATGETPLYASMLRRVCRRDNASSRWRRTKAFHETDRVLALHNHFPLACLGGACSSYALETSHARLQHHRDVIPPAPAGAGVGAALVRDTTLWRWKEQLLKRVHTVLNNMHILPIIYI